MGRQDLTAIFQQACLPAPAYSTLEGVRDADWTRRLVLLWGRACRRTLQLVLICIAVSGARLTVAAQSTPVGIWAGRAVRVSDLTGTTLDARSPDGIASVRQSGTALLLARGASAVPLRVSVTPFLTEILWAPDSSAFVVNTSDGGAVGTWDGFYFQVNTTRGAPDRNIRDVLSSRVKGFARCQTIEELNLGIAGWLRDGHELLVLAEVPPHSSCRNAGALRGYRVDVSTWKIVSAISERALRTQWRSQLGERFRR